jgi:hypothetical protein
MGVSFLRYTSTKLNRIYRNAKHLSRREGQPAGNVQIAYFDDRGTGSGFSSEISPKVGWGPHIRL